MSAERRPLDEPVPDPVLARALEALPPVQADPDFRARLRAQFVSGATPVPGDSGAGDARTRARPAPGGAPRRGAPLRLVATLVTLAAAVLVAFFLTTRGGSGEAWTLVDGTSGQLVWLDDRPTPADDPEAIASALSAGAVVRTPEGATLSLRLGERVAVHVGPASEVRLPRPARGLRDAPLELGARIGHVSVATGPSFEGTLRVRAPELEAEIVGTRFAVDVSEKGTCVCCAEGTVAVRSLALPDESGQVAAGSLAFGQPDGSLMFAEMVVDDHVAPLEELGDAWR